MHINAYKCKVQQIQIHRSKNAYILYFAKFVLHASDIVLSCAMHSVQNIAAFKCKRTKLAGMQNGG